ncbi:MAG: acyl carrier protein [Gammaproteobacteria bacterium]
MAAEPIQRSLTAFIKQKAKVSLTSDTDVFGSGLVSSLFALQLLMYIEQSFNVSVGGGDLTLDNFRTVDAMTALVVRLKGNTSD